MSERRVLTNEEVVLLDRQQHDLKAAAEKQCAEQCIFLRRAIAEHADTPLITRVTLCDIIDRGGFSVSLFRVTDANVASVLTVQIVYAIHDDLEAYLRRPAPSLPEKLRGFLDGGITLESKPTAVDLMPQTGKTKTR